MIQKDVIVIGAGCAGMAAALEAHKQGAEVGLIDRGSIGLGTNSAMAYGGFAGPTSDYGPEEYVQDTLLSGKKINNEPSVRLAGREASHAFSFLRSMGLQLEEFHGHFAIRSPRPDLIGGITLVKTLAKAIRNLNKIEIFSGLYVTEIIKKGEVICGVAGFGKTGEEVILYSPAVVVATGGAGAIYLRNDNQKGIMGQGYLLAAKAGLELWDMEFVQFFPLVMAQPGLPSLLIYPPYPEEARLINTAGEDVLKKHGIDDITDGIATKRDAFSAILFQEGLEGTVYMDYRRVPEALWDKSPYTLLPKKKFDFRRRPFAVSPAAHFFMGGVRTDEGGQTSLPGLFACGEARWGLHGANRMRGNALTECLVSGRIAGRHAAQYSRTGQASPPSNLKGFSKASSNRPSPDRALLRELRRQIRETAWTHAGVVRSRKGLKEGFAKIAEVEKELRDMIPKPADRRLKEDLMSASFVLKAILTASFSREESRGAFIREDFPRQDDVNWKKNSCLAYDREGGTFSIRHYSPGSVRPSPNPP